MFQVTQSLDTGAHDRTTSAPDRAGNSGEPRCKEPRPTMLHLSRSRRSASEEGPRAAAARRRPRSSLADGASRSCPSRSRGLAAGTPTGCRYAARTGSRRAPRGPATACGPDTESAAHAEAAAAPSGPTARRTRSTVISPHPTERASTASDTAISADAPHCVSRC